MLLVDVDQESNPGRKAESDQIKNEHASDDHEHQHHSHHEGEVLFSLLFLEFQVKLAPIVVFLLQFVERRVEVRKRDVLFESPVLVPFALRRGDR